MVRITIYIFCIFLIGLGNSFGDITFVANVDGNWDLFYADDGGKKNVRLTNTPFDEKNPSWSSDKKYIVYATNDGKLNIINITTLEIQPIPVGKNTASKMHPDFSSDDKQIAFSQFIPGKGDDTELKKFHIETKKFNKIHDQPSTQVWPVWSPDGSRLVYANIHCTPACGRTIQELWIADPQGGWARQLLTTSSLCQQPDWSPDGKKIAFSSDKSGNFDIWILSLKEWNLEQITTHDSMDTSPAWSPDEKKLAFVSTRSGIMEIWIKDLKKNNLHKLKPFGDKNIECKDVAW